MQSPFALRLLPFSPAYICANLWLNSWFQLQIGFQLQAYVDVRYNCTIFHYLAPT